MKRQKTLASFGAVRIRQFDQSSRQRTPTREAFATVGLHLVTSGHVEVRAPDRPHRFTAGDAFLIEHGDVLHSAASEPAEALSIVIPAAALATAAPAADEVRRISGSGSLLAPAFAFARRAAETAGDTVSSLGSYYTERLLQEMVIGVAVEALNLQPAQDPSDLFQRATAVIEARLPDETLIPRSIAEQVNISLRQLERAFQAQGTTVERRIRAARVEYADTLLRDPMYDAMTVTTIARHAGFSNGSSLARALGREGFASPAQIRRTRDTGDDEIGTDRDVIPASRRKRSPRSEN